MTKSTANQLALSCGWNRLFWEMCKPYICTSVLITKCVLNSRVNASGGSPLVLWPWWHQEVIRVSCSRNVLSQNGPLERVLLGENLKGTHFISHCLCFLSLPFQLSFPASLKTQQLLSTQPDQGWEIQGDCGSVSAVRCFPVSWPHKGPTMVSGFTVWRVLCECRMSVFDSNKGRETEECFAE
jgi:hypothetical protein